MKNQFLTSIFCFCLFSCASSQVIESYLAQEIVNNKAKNIHTVLFPQKSKSKSLLNVFGDPVRKRFAILPKSYNENEFIVLIEDFKNDTITKYWSKKEQKQFKINELLPKNYNEKVNLLEKKNTNNIVFYELSNPIYINKEENAIFLLHKSKGVGKTIEHSVIVMKKENKLWVFVEKVNSIAAFD